jgi:hypothetical protein
MKDMNGQYRASGQETEELRKMKDMKEERMRNPPPILGNRMMQRNKRDGRKMER